MKPSSRVVFVANVPYKMRFLYAMKGIVLPQTGSKYTVRDLEEEPDGEIYIRLEEILNPVLKGSDSTGEPNFFIGHFRELQPNEDLSELTDIEIMEGVEQEMECNY